MKLNLILCSLLIYFSTPIVHAQENLDSELEESHVEDGQKEALKLDEDIVPLIKKNKSKLYAKLKKDPHKIYHPNAAKGLYKITKERVYLYRVKPSEENRSSSVRFGSFTPTQLSNSKTGHNFDDIYDEGTSFVLFYDYEWLLFKGFGETGFKVGSGFFYATGKGRFNNTTYDNTGLRAEERFTFLAFPNNVALTYKFKFWSNQTFVPIIEGGADYYTFAELRDDDKSPKLGGALAAHAAAGIGFNISSFNYFDSLTLDREYGINSILFLAEFRQLFGLQPDFDISGSVISMGFLVTF